MDFDAKHGELVIRDFLIACAALLSCAACSQQTEETASTATPPTGALAYTELNPSDYQSFVANWSPQDQSFCGAFGSAAEWNAVMQPAATMGSHTYGPPNSLWADHAVLLLASVGPSGDAAHVFEVQAVKQTSSGIEVDYTFAPPPAASSTQKYYFAISVLKPITGSISFVTNGHPVCETELGAAHAG